MMWLCSARMLWWNVVSIAVLVLMAGCTAPQEPASASSTDLAGTSPPPSVPGTPGDSATATSQAPATSSAATSSSAGTNKPPILTLTASHISGPAPLAVAFTLNGNDPDGDPLNWTFDADGDGVMEGEGTTLPESVQFTYPAGTYVATFLASDGKATGVLSLDITAEDPQVVDATYTIASEGCHSWAVYDTLGQDPMRGQSGTLNGVVRVQFEVKPSTVLEGYRAEFTFDVGYLAANVAFYDADGDLLDSNALQAPNFGNLVMKGVVPENAAAGVLHACAGPTVAKVHYQAPPPSA